MTFSVSSLVFIAVVFLIFSCIKRRARAYFLLLASLAFIFYLDRNSCYWVLATSVIVFLWGLIESSLMKRNRSHAKVFMAVGVILCVSSLFLLKHVAKWNFPDEILKSLIMPLGFSYYIFQAIAYIVDIYQEKTEPERNIFIFALYMCFFPKFVSGPIEPPEKLLPQIRNLRRFNVSDDSLRLSVAFPTVLYGFFMKTVVADRLAMYAPKILDFPNVYGSQWLFVGMLMYTMQIYCDFAGYSAIAVGVSRALGIRLTENFNAPYLSPNITAFWRRWHISLSTWLRNYIYIPLGGNRKGLPRKLLNTMIVFIVCGLWHGMGLSFVIWGVLHGIYSIVDTLLTTRRKEHAEPKPEEKEKSDASKTFTSDTARTVLCTIGTFFAVSVAWIFFGAPNTRFAITYIYRMLRFSTGEFPMDVQTLELGIKKFDLNLIPYGIIVFAMDLFMVKTKLPFGEAVHKIPPVVRYIIEYLLIMAIVLLGVYGPGYNAADYLYQDF